MPRNHPVAACLAACVDDRLRAEERWYSVREPESAEYAS